MSFSSCTATSSNGRVKPEEGGVFMMVGGPHDKGWSSLISRDLGFRA